LFKYFADLEFLFRNRIDFAVSKINSGLFILSQKPIVSEYHARTRKSALDFGFWILDCGLSEI